MSHTTVAVKSLDAEVTHWTDLGWTVIEQTSQQVVLQRVRQLPFCLNVLLCLATGFLWLTYVIPRIRHPRIDTKVLSVGEGR